MTPKEAYTILGLPQGTQWNEVKKRYRQLIMQVHPDSNAASGPGPHHTDRAQEINQAYSVLKNVPASFVGSVQESSQGGGFGKSAKKKQPAPWNAPVNENAYAQREILHYAEDQNGAVLGSFCIARGKYMWTTEEDFPLFLLSLYRCGRQLLDQAHTSQNRKGTPASREREKTDVSRNRVQAELTYLLAQQFIDGTSLLEKLAKETDPDDQGRRIFHISSILETSGQVPVPAPGEPLYPSGIRQHRLYVRNRDGQELGYVSFPDDRLYYVVIPLFEQKAVQVRIQTAEKGPGKALCLWIKLLDETAVQMPENLNLQIAQLLERFRSPR